MDLRRHWWSEKAVSRILLGMSRFLLCAFVILLGSTLACGGSSKAPPVSPTSSATPQETSTDLAVEPVYRAPGEDRLIIKKIALDAPVNLRPAGSFGTPATGDGPDDVALTN